MDDIELLSGILDKTGDVVAATRPDQLDRPTPCPDFDVRALLAHIVGWAQAFAAAANGTAFEGDPSAFDVGDNDPAAEFRASARSLVDGWSSHGTDRTVRLGGGEMPASMVLNMTFMEYLTHGWDLATATGQQVPYTDEEAEETLRRARETLQPQYRGASIGAEVAVRDDAPALDRLVGFMGRRP